MSWVSKEFKGNETDFKKEYTSFKKVLINKKIVLKDDSIMLQELRNGSFIDRTYMGYKSMLGMMYPNTKYRLRHNDK